MTLHQFLTILLARRKIALGVLALTVLTTLLVSLYMPKTYKATTTVVIDYKAADPVNGMTLPAQLMPGYMAMQTDIIGSRNVALRVVDELDLAHDPSMLKDLKNDAAGGGDVRERLADMLSKKLDIKPSRESSTISLSCENADPRLAAALANAFADAYIQTSLSLKTEPSRQAAAWFGGQVKDLRDSLVRAQQSLADYQRDTGIVSLDERLDVENARLTELANQLVLAQAQTYDTASKQRQTYSGKRLDQLDADLSGARQREAAVRAALDRQKALVLQISQQRAKLAVLQGDVANAQKVLDTAMQRFGQTRLESQANQTEVAVLDRATPPPRPSKPRMLLNLAISLFLGIMLATGTALLAEGRDRRIHEPDDLAIGLGLPVLGVIAVPGLGSRS